MSTIALVSSSTTREEMFKLLHKIKPSLSPHNSASKLVVAPIFLVNPAIQLPSSSLTTPPQPAILELSMTDPSVFSFLSSPPNPLNWFLNKSSRRGSTVNILRDMLKDLCNKIWAHVLPPKHWMIPTLPNKPSRKRKHNPPRHFRQNDLLALTTIIVNPGQQITLPENPIPYLNSQLPQNKSDPRTIPKCMQHGFRFLMANGAIFLLYNSSPYEASLHSNTIMSTLP